MNLLSRFCHSIQQQQLFHATDQLVIAVSGGVDSVVLCELCHQAGYSFSIAHCNFQLRDEESQRDEAFVRQLANNYGVNVWVKAFDTTAYATTKKISIQEAARALRYAWFAEITGQQAFLLTAHHADDNAETVLMHFCRGTGLHGLTGIPVAIGHIRRPLLGFSKKELLDFAQECQLQYVEDSSNASDKYTRNLFRNQIIPAISQVYPAILDNLRDNIARFKEIEKLYNTSVAAIRKKLCKIKGAEVHIPVKQLMQYNNRALLFEIIRAYGFNEKQVDELVKLSTSSSGKYISSPGNEYRIIRHRHWFIISPVTTRDATATLVIEKKEGLIHFSEGSLAVQVLPPTADPSGPSFVAQLATDELEFPLLLRRWKTGDYFYPLGMRKKKKVSRFLIDSKLSKQQKENTWVLESNSRIAWIVGQRIDDRFKIKNHTTEVLRIELISGPRE